MPEPQESAQPATPSKHVLLVIGEVPAAYVAEHFQGPMSSPVCITRDQACLDPFVIADLMCGTDGEESANAEAIAEYFRTLTGGHELKAVHAVVMDQGAWLSEDNMFVNGDDAPLRYKKAWVYHTDWPVDRTGGGTDHVVHLEKVRDA